MPTGGKTRVVREEENEKRGKEQGLLKERGIAGKKAADERTSKEGQGEGKSSTPGLAGSSLS